MNVALVALALCTGVVAGGLFAFLQIPVPAPPKLAGLMGIVGLFLGYRLVEWTGVGVDLLDALGVA